MQDKKSFGRYITKKRKEANLTQEELASKLYVLPTTISKWERGITYPDITMISNLCRELNISEHEFFMACDDVALNEELKDAHKYRMIKKLIKYTLDISYLIAIITCFICNIVINHTLSWSLIVLVSILLAFSITDLPFYLAKNKYRLLKVTTVFSILLYLLLITINFVEHGNWLISAIIIASFVLILLWLDVLIWTFTKLSKSLKISWVLVSVAICTAFTNPLCEKVLKIPSNSDNIYNIVVALILVLISIILYLKNISSNK